MSEFSAIQILREINFGDSRNPKTTVWKCQNFSAIQILREINFGDFGNPKTGILIVFRGSEF